MPVREHLDGVLITVRVAVSGHRGLAGETAALVDRAIREALAEYLPGLRGLSCLADGADQIFARAVLDLGGALEVVIPAERYRDGLPGECRAAYDELLGRARRAHRLEFVESTAESHMAASERMLDDADVLVAVWDGQPARGHGGTADVVAEARRRGMSVRVIWPEGARRG
ncbi:hypothetical protein [Nonomuraea sp. NPDC001831]|uniref:hypothetical protein n=1 Tax=Nonomuraea sp. NPDC001831 TaxID=3364340 RepID=UPI0036C30D36